ncbi:MAG: bifunctional 4-hydroxy-2-oxoglutarate aldolase/2-dehydro-3-deoxy-phosphogluconate aldolase [Deltaproteobacteria bacterium]|nr:bifunctional 4-hydroxy-2-oxoglutarate aldolase/2-dehydro-3-deoxy-phosphogluconate aldolase [Deltaproteobacteria bacterium]
MNSKLIFPKLEEFRIIPVVSIERAESSIKLADALIEAGLPCAEITFRTKDAVSALKKISYERKEVVLGAGTVLKVDQVKEASDNGAEFIVSPGFNPKVVDYCLRNNITVIPGTSNPTDIEMALDFDLNVIKFFPAEGFGGIKTLKAISAPYSMMKFIPTGGINIQNCMGYLSFSKVLAVGGSWMAAGSLIEGGDFRKITRLTKEAMNLVHGKQEI